MKQKLVFALMLLFMSLCSSSVWAEQVRPTMPTASLESGKTYYLYNVKADLFLGYDVTNIYGVYLGVNENPLPIEITLLDNGAYNMRVTSITDEYTGYIFSYDDYCRPNGSYDSSHPYCYWAIAKEEDCLLIQRSPLNTDYYDADQYLGWQGGEDIRVMVKCPITDRGVQWKLIPADGTGDRYVAALKLYKAINMAEAFVDNGWNIDYYTNLYASRATADIDEMTNAAYSLRNGLKMSQGYKAPYWNEYPILWQTADGEFGNGYDKTWALPDNRNTSGTYFERVIYHSGESALSATVAVDEPSTFIYGLQGSVSDVKVTVYVDGVKTREIVNEQICTYTTANSNNYTYTRYFEALETGTHTIKWVFKSTEENNYSSYCYICNAGVMKSPLITVSLLEPGSLGTEVLYNTDHIKNVRRLKIKGKMNSDDWAKIKMMHYLQDLDLSEAKFTEIPEYQFSCANDTSSLFIHAMKLPEGLEKINRDAFHYSFIDHLDFPSTVTTVDLNAFSYSHLQELVLPDNLTTINNSYYHTFGYMYWLKKLVCPKNLTEIPRCTFYQNYYCEEVTLPEELIKINEEAFYYNKNMKIIFPNKLQTIGEKAFYGCTYADFSALPESLESIGSYAFWDCNGINTLKIPENVSSIGYYAFQNCNNLKEVEIGTKIYNLSDNVFDKCTRLEKLRMNCPTVVTYNTSSYSYPVPADHIKDVTLIVPNHMVTSYKLDNYWYNFKSIEGFSTADLQDWTINRPLVLNRDRFEGTPNITINGDKDRWPSLKINGDTPMTINNLKFDGSYSDYPLYCNYPGQILSQCNNITVQGGVQTSLRSIAQNWYFYSLPFDVKVSEITHSADNVQKAVRYYDGANRAANGSSGSWKNYDADAVIPAGTGFIMQTNVDTWNYFHAVDNANKALCVSNSEIVKTLEVNDSQTASDKGWNLVGNPWQCYFNDHALNFTAPITVWSVRNRTYTAYSIADDDYAIAPNEAFFVQCPNAEFNTIGFPTNGRQLTDVIETQNAAKPMMTAAHRLLVNVKISNDENEDQTRVVLNENASIDYEMNCDASKMMSMDASVPQIYTLGVDDEQYAINERPVGIGIIPLGIYTANGGTYTLSLGRCDAENVVLIDYETGTEHPLNSDYTFTANAGYDNGRFALKFNAGETTGIATLNGESLNDAPCYNIAGQRVMRGTKDIVVIGGRKIVNK